MEADQNGMTFKTFKGWLSYCDCEDDQWDPATGYYVFINPRNNRFAYLNVVDYVDLINIYRTCNALSIPTPPHLIDIEKRVRRILENL